MNYIIVIYIFINLFLKFTLNTKSGCIHSNSKSGCVHSKNSYFCTNSAKMFIFNHVL